MKTSFTVAAWIFAALLVLAVPTSASRRLLQGDCPPTQAQVSASIDQWNQDVLEVNNFLNVAATLADPTGAAANTEQVALNEPVQLGILGNVVGLSTDAQNAVTLLMEVFGNVPTDLQSIVTNPSASNVQTQLNSINNVRCLNVLPALDILWPAAAVAVGLDVANVPAVARPNACATIS
ncbi:unnamed protein product [Calypogeia fissa]